MNSKINSVNSATQSAGISPTVASGYRPQAGGITYQEKFNFTEIELPKRTKVNIEPSERLNFKTMVKLFTEILQSGVDIIPQAPRDHGKYIVEASFKPTLSKTRHHTILAPLRGVKKPLTAPPQLAIYNSMNHTVEEYVAQIIDNSTDDDIIRLIIVMGHEFGHYLSFVRGYHDNELKFGIHLMHSKQVSGKNGKYTWLVFREEVTAWKFASDVLKRYKFEFLDAFEKVKINSLQTYYTSLNLEQASLDVYFKLSMLGDDFINSCKPSISTPA
ncbi:MAG: hypothetical protein ACK5Z5_01375 [Neisseriaceae bacterium]